MNLLSIKSTTCGLSKGASLAQDAAVGVAGGSIVGALASLLRETPTLHKTLRDALIGAGVGGVAGATANHFTENPDAGVTEELAPPPAPAPKPAPTVQDIIPEAASKEKMNLLTAAASNVVPVIGPVVHGGAVGGAGQAALSGAGSFVGGALGGAAATHITPRIRNPKLNGAASLLLPLLAGSAGAAAAANRA